MRRVLTPEERRAVYDKTRGKCHLCHSKMAFTNYGRVGARMAWEIEHSVARVNGGTDRLGNLYAACIGCNRAKGAALSRTIRARNGIRRAPMTYGKYEAAKRANALGGAATGGIIGFRFGGPAGAMVGALLGAFIGGASDPDD